LSYSYSYFRYYHPDAKKAETAMRPSSTLNAIIDGHLQANTIAK
jgi:monomeric isocitrate dehydrogenase